MSKVNVKKAIKLFSDNVFVNMHEEAVYICTSYYGLKLPRGIYDTFFAMQSPALMPYEDGLQYEYNKQSGTRKKDTEGIKKIFDNKPTFYNNHAAVDTRLTINDFNQGGTKKLRLIKTGTGCIMGINSDIYEGIAEAVAALSCVPMMAAEGKYKPLWIYDTNISGLVLPVRIAVNNGHILDIVDALEKGFNEV